MTNFLFIRMAMIDVSPFFLPSIIILKPNKISINVFSFFTSYNQ